MKALLLVLMLLPVTLVGRDLVWSNQSDDINVGIGQVLDPTAQDTAIAVLCCADREFRSLIIMDYSDAVKYQDWEYIRRIARFLTWAGKRNE